MIRTIYQCDRCGLATEVDIFTTIQTVKDEVKQKEYMLCPTCYDKVVKFILSTSDWRGPGPSLDRVN